MIIGGSVLPDAVQAKTIVTRLFSASVLLTLTSLTPYFTIVRLGIMSKYMGVSSMLPIRSLRKSCFCLLTFTSSRNAAILLSRSPGSFWATDVWAQCTRLCWQMNFLAQPSEALNVGLWGLIKTWALSWSICVDTAGWHSHIQSTHFNTLSSRSLG